MICKASADEAKLLDRCLKYASSYFDELNITITRSLGDDYGYLRCEHVARKYNSKISEFKWVKDFSKARNYNFSQATGDYIMWLDCDDILKNGHLIKETVEDMQKNGIDTVIFPYLYDFDSTGLCTVRHLKTRIVKNDGCVTWVGALHEDFHQNREIRQFLDEKIEVLHITDEKRAEQSSERNLAIAKSELLRAKNDPRSHYLVANAYLAQHDTKNALKYLRSFLEMSHSDEEKYLVYLNMADILEDQREEYIAKAWTLRPAYPNSYFKMGEHLYRKGKYKEAKNFIELGLQMPKPDTSIIVYNPREYDYVPLSLMVNICFELGEYSKALATMDVILKLYPNDDSVLSRKKAIEKELGDVLKVDEILKELEKIGNKRNLKRRLDELPPSLQAHPKICFFRNKNFVKETSSGKDLVYYCSFTEKVWTPESVEKGGVGGSEEAVINISKNLQKLGWNVTVYNNCGKGGEWDGVKYKPWWSYNVKDKQDVTIVWRHPKTIDFLDKRAGKVFVDMHDVMQDGEFTKERVSKIEKVFVKSKAHRILFPSIPDEKIAIIPNGVDVSLFEKTAEKNPYLILNTSSADRHLETTLDIFEELIKRQPDKPWKLAWYYGWGVYDSVHKDNKEMMDWKNTQMARFDALKALGRAEGGYMLSHVDIANKYLEAGVFLYATSFWEVHCISALKAQIAGCKTITSDFAALDETVQYGRKIHTKGEKWGKENTFGDSGHDGEYIDAILDGICLGEKPKKEDVSWERITELWNKEL